MAGLRVPALLILSFLLLGLTVHAQGNPWQAFKTPAPGPPRAIGDYSAGCLQGALALPLNGDGYQIMHPSRLRYFGHPDLVSFLKKLGRAVEKAGLGVVLLGDMSQSRGGRALGGHASHETGLDVDIWYWYPKPAAERPLSAQEREQLTAVSILDSKTSGVQAEWLDHVSKVLRLTAEDARVERVFVHPIIKRELCAQPGQERGWLRKIRPWHGHDDHFHVRLACPKDSPDCTPQTALPPGDGCGELEWWFSDSAQADREKALKRYQRKVSSERKLPARCYAMLK